MIQWLGKLIFGDQFVKWLGSFVENTGSTSASKLALVYAATTFVVCILLLTIGVLYQMIENKYSAVYEYGLLIGGLLAAAGVSYSVKNIWGDKIKKQESGDAIVSDK